MVPSYEVPIKHPLILQKFDMKIEIAATPASENPERPISLIVQRVVAKSLIPLKAEVVFLFTINTSGPYGFIPYV